MLHKDNYYKISVFPGKVGGAPYQVPVGKRLPRVGGKKITRCENARAAVGNDRKRLENGREKRPDKTKPGVKTPGAILYIRLTVMALCYRPGGLLREISPPGR